MKNIFRTSLLIVALATMALTSCKKDEPKTTYVVTFDAQNGTTPTTVNVDEGTLVTKPANPTKTGYEFGGWYKESACTTEWNFSSDKVNANITLYAKWEQTAAVVSLQFLDHYGDFAGTGTEDFYMAFLTEANVAYVLDLYSQDAVPNGTNVSPSVGTYNFDKNTTGAAFTIGAADSGVSTDGATFTSVFKSGSVKISKVGNDYKVEGNLVDDKGVNCIFVYQGPFSATPYVEPSIYSDEPTTTVNNVTINTVTVYGNDNYGDYYSSGGDNLYFIIADASDANGIYADFICSGSGLTSLPAGTYPINGSFGLNTVVAYVQSAVDMGGGTKVIYNGDTYFIVSGNVVVTASGFTVTGTSYNGSTFTVNYTGSLAVTAVSAAPATLKSKTLSLKVKNLKHKTFSLKR